MDIEFCDLSYHVVDKGCYFNKETRKTTILKNINGRFTSGKLCAILGPSGAGKSSLLEILSGLKSDNVQGTLLANGLKQNQKWFQYRSSYIAQETAYPCYTTVQDIMTIAAELKLSQSFDRKTKQNIIINILKQLGIEEVSNSLISNLSGGERKRLSIALELFHNPKIFYLDEPTTGVDDKTARQIIVLLQKLARDNRNVIVSIHQPSAYLLNLFDYIYIIAAGKCVYQGIPNNIISFLESSGYICPSNYNPADYILELTDNIENVNILSENIQNGKTNEFCDRPDKIEKEINYSINNNIIHGSNLRVSQEENEENMFAVSQWYQFQILLHRYFKHTVNNRLILILQAIHYVGCAVGIGTMWYDYGNNGAQAYEMIKFLISFILIFMFTRMTILVIFVPCQLKVFKKEYLSRWYSLGPYFCAKTLAELPSEIFFNSLFISITYFLVGFPKKLWMYLMFILIGNMIAIASDGVGFIIGTIVKPENGMIVSTVVSVMFLVFGIYGFDYPKNVSWEMNLVKSMTIMHCGLSSLAIVLFGFDREELDCKDEELFCYFSKPKALLNFLNLEDNDFYKNMCVLFILLLILRLLPYYFLRRKFR